MGASKLLQNTRVFLNRNLLQIKKSGEPIRGRHTMAVPARVKLSVGEQLAYATVLSVSLFFIPFWVLYHIPDYQNENRNEYTGK